MIKRHQHSPLRGFVCGCFAASLAVAGGVQLSGPSAGFVYDTVSRSVRPIIGVPGSAYLGDPVQAGLDFGSISPDGRSAIIVRSGNLSLVRQLQGDSATIVTLAAVTAVPDMFAWAPDSRAAVWFSQSSLSVSRASNLEKDPIVDGPFDISTIPGQVVTIAVGATGTSIALAISQGPSNGIYSVSQGAPPQQVASVPQPSAMVFDRLGDDLFFSDASTGNIYKIAAFSSLAGLSMPVVGAGTPTDIAGLAISWSDTTLYATLLAEQTLCVYDLASGSLSTSLTLDSPPTSLQHLSKEDLFVLTGSRGAADPILLLDGRTAPAVYFVPSGGRQ